MIYIIYIINKINYGIYYFIKYIVYFYKLTIIIIGLKVISIAGCSRASQSEMIQFAAKHKIYPKIEVLPAAKINEAFEKVKKNAQRYRMVLTF